MSDDQHTTSSAPEDTGSGSGAESSQLTVEFRATEVVPSRPDTGEPGSHEFTEAWAPEPNASSLAQQMAAQSGSDRPSSPAAPSPPPGVQSSGTVTPSDSSD